MSSSGYNDSFLAKCVATFVMEFISIAIGIAPQFCLPWLRRRNLTRFIAILKFIHNCARGFVLTTTFLKVMPGVIGTYLKFEEGYITKNPIFDAMLFISLGFFILCALDVGLHFYLGYINRLYSHRSIEQELQLTNQPSNNPSNDDTIELRPLPYSRPCPSPDSSPCPPPDSSPCPSLDSIPCRRNVFSDKDSEVFAAIEGFVLVSSLTYHEFYEGMTLWSSTSPERAWYEFGAMVTYKFVIAHFLGYELYEMKCNKSLANNYIFLSSLIYPIGIFVGMQFIIVGNRKLIAVLHAIATGILLYGLFFQILREVTHETKKWIPVFLGFAVMVLIQAFVNH